jgi:hypothetical protein
MNIFMGILGALIAVVSLLSGVGIYTVATNAIQQIYAALLMITAVLGLVMVAVAAGAAAIHDALLQYRQAASQQNGLLISALQAIADRQPPRT